MARSFSPPLVLLLSVASAGAQDDGTRLPIADALTRDIRQHVTLPPGAQMEIDLEDGKIVDLSVHLDETPDLFENIDRAGFALNGNHRDQLRR